MVFLTEERGSGAGKEKKKKQSWEECAKSRKMDLTSNKEKLTTVSGIFTKTEKLRFGDGSVRGATGRMDGNAIAAPKTGQM